MAIYEITTISLRKYFKLRLQIVDKSTKIQWIVNTILYIKLKMLNRQKRNNFTSLLL